MPRTRPRRRSRSRVPPRSHFRRPCNGGPTHHLGGPWRRPHPPHRPADRLHSQRRDSAMGKTPLEGKLGEHTLVTARLPLPQFHPPCCRAWKPASWQQTREVQLQTTLPFGPQTPPPGTTTTARTGMGHHRGERRSGGHPPKHRHQHGHQTSNSSPCRTPAAQPRVPIRTMAERTP